MSCNDNCKTPGCIPSTTLKPIIRGDSWAWYWNLSSGCPPVPIGDNTWAAEFGLVDPRDPRNVLFKTNTTDGGVFWSNPGVLTVVIPQATTAAFAFCDANFYMDVVAPTPLDANGFRQTIQQGKVELPLRGALPNDDLLLGPVPRCAGNIDYANGGGFPFFPFTPYCGR